MLDKADSNGLSPRVRGNQATRGGAPKVKRSIPACTGEPHCDKATASDTGCGLSPRVRGNRSHKFLTGLDQLERGLSPRVRGNPRPCEKTKVNREEGLSPRVRGNLDHALFCRSC